jgi:methyl-accepting chemotaxis protein
VAELIAEKESKPGTEGSGAAGDIYNLGADLVSDSQGWDTLLDEAMVGIDILMNCENPLGGLISAGVGWLLEHIPGISDIWDKLTGDPQAIEQIANTWDNISRSLGESQTSYLTASNQIEKWSGPASDSYRQVANAYASSLSGASMEAEALAVVVRLVGGLAATVKDAIYKIISDFVEFTVLPAILGAIATSWCTFGGSIGVAITYIEIQADITAGQVTVKITETTEEITVISERTAKVLAKLAKMKTALKDLSEELEKNKTLASKAKELAEAAARSETEQTKGGIGHRNEE